jgi:hypothetical protein
MSSYKELDNGKVPLLNHGDSATYASNEQSPPASVSFHAMDGTDQGGKFGQIIVLCVVS